MDTSLNRAVAAVVYREVGEDRSARAEFMRRSGVDKSTFSRKIRGVTDKVSLEEADAWARGLGWSLNRLIKEARAYQADAVGDPGLPQDAYDLAAMNTNGAPREVPFDSQERAAE